MKPKIDFITIAVTDLERSVAFYKDGLGLPTRGIQDGSEEHCLFDLDDNFRLVLYRRNELLGLMENPDQVEYSAGFILSHIASSKEEVDSILQKAVKAGATQIGETQDEAWGYSSSFADPDGHPWEISFMPHYVKSISHES